MLATIDDLAELGAVPIDWSPDEAEGVRALGLLKKAEAAAFDFLSITESDVEGWTEARRTRLISWIAEKASMRLFTSAAPQIDPYGNVAMPMSIKLNSWDKAELREIGRKSGLAVLDTTRSDTSWLEPIEEYDPYLAGWPN